jgi:hypothetical protein
MECSHFVEASNLCTLHILNVLPLNTSAVQQVSEAADNSLLSQMLYISGKTISEAQKL